MSTTPVWQGSAAVTETPDSPRLIFGETDTELRTYEGPYATVLAARPAKGSSAGGYTVIQSEVNKLEGGRGRLLITWQTPDFAPPSAGGDRRTEQYEVEWNDLERDLLLHPRYDTGGDKVLTLQDRADIAAWRIETDTARKVAYQYWIYSPTLGNYTVDLSVNAQDAAAKILKGTESYPFSFPTARILSLFDTEPSTQPTQTYRTTKPFPAAPDGYGFWVRTADRSLRAGRRGRWQRSIEYRGVNGLDIDLYTLET